MGDLSERDVEDVLGGVQPPGRDDLAHVVELTTWLHVSREIEPPPAMRDDLFCQIEDGLWVYQRSSRRAPAHLRHRPTSRRRLVRETLAGSGRPIASVAAAAVLLVGVILAVRAGGPAREPSAFVSPSAQGLPAPGADAPTATTTTTSAPTTTSPPTSASEPAARADTGTTVPDSEHSTTAKTTEAPASADTSSAEPQTGDHDGTTPPTTEERPYDDDGATAGSDEGSPGGRLQPPPTSEPTDDTVPWDLPLSGWDFDLSEWPPAKDLWAALEEAEEMGEAVEPGDEAPAGDDERDRDHYEVGESERGFAKHGVSERRHGRDAEE